MQFTYITPNYKLKWENFVNNHPLSSGMQMWEWCVFRNRMGTDLYRRVGVENKRGDLVLTASFAINRFRGIGNIIYIPQGPVWSREEALKVFYKGIREIAKKNNCFAVILEPRIQKKDQRFRDVRESGFKYVGRGVQPRRTILVDLSKSQREIYKNFGKRTQSKIEKIKKHKFDIIRLDKSEDIAKVIEICGTIDKKDNEQGYLMINYLENLWVEFAKGKKVTLWRIQLCEGQMAALLMINNNYWAGTICKITINDRQGFNGMPLLVWEGMKEAKRRGCVVFDFLGARRSKHKKELIDISTKEKMGFRGKATSWVGTYEVILDPFKYKLWNLMQNLNIIDFYEREYLSSY